mmetsp:Transcript_21647/g.43238  ORF Transcript_21647/g.43238 Transcript_21647/m.43238 type:complete len:331 (+) Transcript_21647:20-1012(+)
MSRFALNHIREQKLRDPHAVMEHASKLGFPARASLSSEEDLAIVEQMVMAACDVGDMETAEKCVSMLKKRFPDSVRVLRLRGLILEASAGYEEANEIYDEMLKRNPANLYALKRKHCIEKAKDPASSVPSLLLYLDNNPSDASGWYSLATLYLSLNDFQGAASAFEEVVLLDPLDAHVHCALAECYYTMGPNPPKGFSDESLTIMARRHFSEACNLKRGHIRSLLGLALSAKASVLEDLSSYPSSSGIGANTSLVDLMTEGKSRVDEKEVGSALHSFAARELDDALRAAGDEPIRKAVKAMMEKDSVIVKKAMEEHRKKEDGGDDKKKRN